MDVPTTRARAGRGRIRAGVAAALIAPGLAIAGCDGILEVDLPGVVEERTLSDPAFAPLLVSSAIADFECAYNNYTFGSAAVSDEWWHTAGPQILREWGGRLITANHDNFARGTCQDLGFGLYTTIHTARFQAEDVFARIQAYPDADVPGNKTAMLAELSAYAGYGYVLLGENFCEMVVDGGPLMQPSAVLEVARDRFLRAMDLAQASGGTDVLNMARVGLARTRRALHDLPGAAEVARLVPEGFVRTATRNAAPIRRENKGWAYNAGFSHFSVAPGYRELEWKGVPDPRVQLEYKGSVTGFDLEWWAQTKYPSAAAPIPIATWTEAQLILAEAELAADRAGEAVQILNALHARAGLPPFVPATDGDVMEHLIRTRARELFLEGGHRLADMLRYGIPLFSGIDHLGREYGTTTCFPLPAIERQGNPHI